MGKMVGQVQGDRFIMTEKDFIYLGIYGTQRDGEDPNREGSMALSPLTEAGKHMTPEPVYSYQSGCAEYLPSKISDPKTGEKHTKFRFVLPFLSFLDLGSFYLPDSWASSHGMENSAPLQKVLFLGYRGVDISRWLITHVETIITFFHDLKGEWDNPGDRISRVRYAFDGAGDSYHRNVNLCIGQLLRFGGNKLLVALRIAEGSEYVKNACL
jgi:hypothetical protein